jgi:hypothetical protein
MSEDISPGSPIRRFIGGVLIVAGVLWLGASGLCSAWFFGMMVVEGGHWQEIMGIVPMILVVGGFSAGVGFALFVIGRAMRPKT